MRKRWLGEGGRVSVGCDGSADVAGGRANGDPSGNLAFGVWSLEGLEGLD